MRDEETALHITSVIHPTTTISINDLSLLLYIPPQAAEPPTQSYILTPIIATHKNPHKKAISQKIVYTTRTIIPYGKKKWF